MTKKHKMGCKEMEVICEMMKKSVTLKEELKTRSPRRIIMFGKIISRPSKLCCDQKTRCRSLQSGKHYWWKNPEVLA